ncbi:MAG: transcription antitermination factor NusB [Ancylobacter novellus]|uniref:Transcription antitermination protein NusB n=1 Tax=Ancylobacter novellus TaxID=921 RepID=A0A2W5K0J6_ANCNO|nr:MAG: transcription antitermination factor NusB [Ancylobacter novellus]
MAKGETRSAARLAAVQALYQMDVAGAPLPDTLAQFESHWLGKVVDGDEYKPADAAFFRDLVGGVLKEQRSLDPLVDRTLASGWPLKRVEAIMRAILRAGAFELGKRRDVPAKVVIKEYVDIAHAFFERDEAGMVNAVLDTIARDVREDDFVKRAQ